jgi:hypothetical protein
MATTQIISDVYTGCVRKGIIKLAINCVKWNVSQFVVLKYKRGKRVNAEGVNVTGKQAACVLGINTAHGNAGLYSPSTHATLLRVE